MPKDSILVIDDDSDTIEFLRIVFNVRGREITGAHTGKIGVNCSGNPMLAQGGSGDLLAGFLGGLLAQPIRRRPPTS